MKRNRSRIAGIVFSFCTSTFCVVAFADQMNSPTYWYGGDVRNSEKIAQIQLKDGAATVGDFTAYVDNGYMFYLDKEHKQPVVVDDAFDMALKSAQTAIEAKQAAANIAKELAKVKWTKKTAEVNDSETGASSTGSANNNQGSIVITGPNLVANDADEKSIEVITENKKKKLQIKGFNRIEDSLSIPYFSSVGLLWEKIGYFADGDSIEKYIGSSTDKSAFIKIAGWGTPTISPHKCNQTLVELMTNATWRASHYVLTRFEADGVTKMHYTPVGELPASLGGGGGALKFVGTDGTTKTVGSGSTTNAVYFASKADSNVSVTIAQTNTTDIVVKIGVYWKD